MHARTAFMLLVAAPALLGTAPASAQNNPRGEAKLTLAGKSIVVEYGRPSLKGRDMLARAEVGQTWRLGADDETTLKTDAALAFGPVVVPKGDYVLTATKVAADRWQLNVSGKEGKVAEVPLSAAPLKDSVEIFTIELQGKKDEGTFVLSWGGQALSAPFKAK
jgi:hypothetical protein